LLVCRAGEGWEHCEYVGVTMDLNVALEAHVAEHGTDTVGHIRALSFAYPQKSAMEEVANRWKESVSSSTAGKPLGDWNVPDDTLTDKLKKAVETGAEAYLFADDDDDDDEFEEFEDVVKETVVDRSMGLLADFAGSMKMAETAEAPPREEAVISPFADGGALMNGQVLPFSKENVDKILDEVRPYLISDGGNVSVQRVVDETRDVYLVLEGACGSCASSTVTMKMGIERVLKENFPDLGQVLQVEDDAGADSNPTELTWEAVNMEVNRIKPAIVAMGGVIEILKVEPIGVVELRFRGSNKVQQGLELALRDVPFVKHVNFVSQ
jgi:Fe-S cluster biogenesis protein NfuA